MSPPDTNVEKQARRHRPALRGIAFALVVGALLVIGYLFWLAYQGNQPGEPDAHVDGRTGEIEEVED